ncbi:MAG: hypothetical protein HY785_22640 [Oscillatoriophycideae cyanobacterium NC_groundwater_1537_Pr4_S-0.65um_50_18]|nr:hypothetical protein [Oscillatoriophycideae cyanobacterium NC_groundwater_1537_Pr4_S-0.65um_50_18]
MPKKVYTASRIGQDLIRRAMADCGLTHKALAQLAMLKTRTPVSNFVNGKPVSAWNFQKFCAILQLDWRCISGELDSCSLDETGTDRMTTVASIFPNSVLDSEVYLAVALKSIHQAISELKHAELSLNQAEYDLTRSIQASQINSNSDDITNKLLDLQFRTTNTKNQLLKLLSILEEFQYVASENMIPENLII